MSYLFFLYYLTYHVGYLNGGLEGLFLNNTVVPAKDLTRGRRLDFYGGSALDGLILDGGGSGGGSKRNKINK